MINVFQMVEEHYSCAHEQQQIVKYQQAHGQWRIRRQCMDCGEYTSSDLKMQGYNLDTLPAADLRIREEIRAMKEQARERVRDELYRAKEELFTPKQNIDAYSTEDLDDDQSFWECYSEYLRSEAWHKMRVAVLRRDGNLCQSCLIHKATQVHHLSYRLFKQVGRSAAFELVAVCHKCHMVIHPHMAELQHNKLRDPRSHYVEKAGQVLKSMAVNYETN